jgi:hypothetical protein
MFFTPLLEFSHWDEQQLAARHELDHWLHAPFERIYAHPQAGRRLPSRQEQPRDRLHRPLG